MSLYPALETARLLLRPVDIDDAPAIQAVFPQWEIVRYLANQVPWPYPEDGALSYLSDVLLPNIAKGTSWSWTIHARAAPERLRGLITLSEGEDDNRGFWLDPAVQGRGYMTEAANAVTDYWFGPLGKTVMRIPKAADNIASVRISEKQGMHLVGSIEKDYVGGRFASQLWEITAAEWRARKR